MPPASTGGLLTETTLDSENDCRLYSIQRIYTDKPTQMEQLSSEYDQEILTINKMSKLRHTRKNRCSGL
jgi:hypothetical protein